MNDNNFYNDDFEEKIDFEEAVETDETCPADGSYLYSITIGRNPDDVQYWLICKNCHYREKE